MKKFIAALTVLICLLTASTAFATKDPAAEQRWQMMFTDKFDRTYFFNPGRYGMVTLD